MTTRRPTTAGAGNNHHNDVSSSTSWNDVSLGNLGGPYHQDAALQVRWKKDSYQLISPGEDGNYGAVNSTGKFVGEGFYQAETELLKREEADNITNFNTGSTLGG